MSFIENQDLVQNFFTNGSDKSFSESIGSRSFGGRFDGFDTCSLEKNLELATELACDMQKCGSQAIAREKTQDVGLANSFATILQSFI